MDLGGEFGGGGMRVGDLISVVRYHNGFRMDDPPITGLVVERSRLVHIVAHKKCSRIKILETTGEIREIFVNNLDITEVL